ncbi:uncharacterized protein N7459_008254 [Penicillium hispanicum]|uniref:uncharacterized protein n=1 Tax=Penicillium hispanicum TaxID=1080232 RepID=UPI0025401DA7|nr:uncharacterized protein N7459_008254 [Penicillium hispanicum]KAJ5573827.1 hypothetical protein N7459_008254 [Penicillium hispanicum]
MSGNVDMSQMNLDRHGSESGHQSMKQLQNSEKVHQRSTHPDVNDGYNDEPDHGSLKKRQNSEKARQCGTHPDVNDDGSAETTVRHQDDYKA